MFSAEVQAMISYTLVEITTSTKTVVALYTSMEMKEMISCMEPTKPTNTSGAEMVMT